MRVFLSLGTNLGDRHYYMTEMVGRLMRVLKQPCATSSLMETEPLGMPPGAPWFLNRIMSGEYNGAPETLHHHCRAIEAELGRVRGKGVTDRTADIDILLFGDRVIANTNLTVPHPGIMERRFCLEGLREIAPLMRHPLDGRTFLQVYEAMDESVRAQTVCVIADTGAAGR